MLTVYRELKGDLRYIFSLGLGVLGFYVTAITLIREFIGKTWYLLALVIGLLLLLVIVGVKYVKVTRLIKELHKIMCENNNMDKETVEAIKDSLWFIIMMAIMVITGLIIALSP